MLMGLAIGIGATLLQVIMLAIAYAAGVETERRRNNPKMTSKETVRALAESFSLKEEGK